MHTHSMLAYVQCLMMAVARDDYRMPLYARLARIKRYLIARYNRE